MAPIVGLFGGTFDPVHTGHLNVVRNLLAGGHIDRCVLVPAARSPLKRDRDITADAHRLAMLRLAAGTIPGGVVTVSDVELRRGGLSYTIVTAAEFAGEYGARLRLIIGMDSLRDLHRWHEGVRLAQEYTFLIYQRPGCVAPTAAELAARFGAAAGARLAAGIVPGTTVAVSASELRASLAAGKDVQALLPSPVCEYIAQQHLYRCRKEGS